MGDGPTSGWQKLGVISGALAAVLIPVVITLVGSWTSTALKDQEIRGQFVGLAVSILQEPPTPGNRSVREWAIQVINQYSDVRLEPEAVETLTDSASLPAPVGDPRRNIDVAAAAAFEREGFEALLRSDFDGAIAAFDGAEAAYPSYHSVFDIARFLRDNRGRLDDPLERERVLAAIASQYSWGAPADQLQRLRVQVGQ